MRVKMTVDGHVFTCHVMEPKDHETDAQLENLLTSSNGRKKSVEIYEDPAMVANHQLQLQNKNVEKSQLETQEKHQR